MRILNADVLVIGSGAAGMLAARACAPSRRVVLVSKGAFGRDGATITAQADIAVDGRSCARLLGLRGADDADTPDRFAADMLREGAYLGRETLIGIQTNAVGEEVAALVKSGLRLRGLLHNPGHRSPRSVWISARELTSILRRETTRAGVDVRAFTLACDLIVSDGAARGALLLDRVSGEFFAVLASAVILATGGGMRVYPFATAPAGLTGDGLAMAYRAGAALADMEFPMFLPYTLIQPPMLRGVTFTHDLAMLSDAHALNRAGERFMARWDPVRMERSTRDINAVAAGVEIASGRGTPAGGVWLSLAHLPANLVREIGSWLPEGLSNWRYGGFDLQKLLPDLSRDALETAPASHFWNGGIVVDADCRTTVPNLYAAGEGIAGLNGANRISGNGLAQAVVWGARAGRRVASHLRGGVRKNARDDAAIAVAEEKARAFEAPLRRSRGASPLELARRIRDESWRGIGLVRDDAGLGAFLNFLDSCEDLLATQAARDHAPQWNEALVASVENRNMADVARMTAVAARARMESRGAHYRSDAPETDEAWNVNLVLRHGGGTKVEVEKMPAANAYAATPREGRTAYGEKRGRGDVGAD